MGSLEPLVSGFGWFLWMVLRVLALLHSLFMVDNGFCVFFLLSPFYIIFGGFEVFPASRLFSFFNIFFLFNFYQFKVNLRCFSPIGYAFSFLFYSFRVLALRPPFNWFLKVCICFQSS